MSRFEDQSLSEQMLDVRSEYNMASSDRLRRNVAQSIAREVDAAFANQEAFFSMVGTSRWWEANEPLLRPALRRLSCNVSPGESRPDPNPAIENRSVKKDAEKALLDLWNEWATDKGQVDVAAEHDWASLSNVAFERAVIDGDCWSLLSDTTESMQIFEALEVRSPGLRIEQRGVAGVVMDENRRKTRAWLSPLGTGSLMRSYYQTDVYKSDGSLNLLQLYFPQFSTQSRGIPALAGVAEKNTMRDDLEFAMLVKQQVSACLTYFEKIDPLAFEMYLKAAEASGKSDAVKEQFFGGDRSKPKKTVEPYPGTVMQGIPGTEWTGFTPSIPSDGYFQQIKLLLTYLAINLDLPLILLLLDASDTTYSSYRHVVEQGRLGFGKMIRQFHSRWAKPVWNGKVAHFAAKSPFVAGLVKQYGLTAVSRHNWIAKVPPWIDPAKDIASSSAELGHGLTSPRRFANARLGCEWGMFYPEQVDDWGDAIEYAIARAAKINEAAGSVQVSWRDLLHKPSPEGIRINLGDSGAKDATADPQKSKVME
jgi:capsid protein